jgi:hypothetical protein
MEACWVQRKLDDALKLVPRRRRKSDLLPRTIMILYQGSSSLEGGYIDSSRSRMMVMSMRVDTACSMHKLMSTFDECVILDLDPHGLPHYREAIEGGTLEGT